jgi:outer membrane protein OmpA-like peptidoglycan-associated protein
MRFASLVALVAALWGFTATSAARAQGDSATPRINFDEISADADKPLYLRYGVFGSLGFTTHIANFAQFDGCITCLPTNFGTFATRGIGGGLLVEFPVFGRLGVSTRLSYYGTAPENSFLSTAAPGFLSTRFTATESVLFASTTGQPQQRNVEHRFSPTLGILGFEPAVTYRPLDALTIYLGAQLGFLLQRQFQYAEIAPSDYLFLLTSNPERGGNPASTQRTLQLIADYGLARTIDRMTGDTLSPVRNLNRGDIAGTNTIVASLFAGVGYEIPLNSTGTWLIAPEFMYFFGRAPFAGLLTGQDRNLVSRTNDGSAPAAASWFMDNARVSLALKYSPFRTIRPELTPELQDKIRQLKRYDSLVVEERKRNAQQLARVDSVNRAITAKMEELKKVGISVTLNKVVGVDDNGSEIPKPSLKIEQFRSQIAQPLLPYIFFDDNSAVLPSRYRRVRAAERNGFKIQDFAGKSNVELYRHILNIIGQRMNDMPTAVLFLTGCNSGQGPEANNTKLSEQRATAISDYLQDVWKIPAKRVVVQKQNLSDHPSGNDANGQAENRRVEMSSNVPELFDPVKTDQLARIAYPPTLRFGLEINAGAGLKQWDMEINQFVDNESVTLKTFGGGNTYPPSVDWNMNKEPNTMPASNQDLSIQLTMTDINNKTGDAPITSIPVQQISVEKKEIDNKADKRIDTYDILGFDVTGNALDESGQKAVEVIKKSLQAGATVIVTGYSDAAGSKESAQRRAELVTKALGKGQVRAVGPTTENDNALPEGRFYNRYVHVEVQTPVR